MRGKKMKAEVEVMKWEARADKRFHGLIELQ